MAKGIINIEAGGLAKEIFSGLDGLFTSDAEKLEAQNKIAETLQQPHIMQALANVESAKNTNWFVAGGRPALFWVCAIALLYHWLLKDMIAIGIIMFASMPETLVPLLPKLDGAEISGLITVLLGLGTMRAVEKINGVARDQ